MAHDHATLKGHTVANRILAEVTAEIAALKDAGRTLKLASICVGDVDAVAVYIRNQRRTAEKCGLGFEEFKFPAETTREALAAHIAALNDDPDVAGIIIQRPVPAHINVRELQEWVHPLKDVEGMHPTSIGNIVYNETDIAPCTAVASVELLKSTGVKLEGLEVVVIGHSTIVGKPIAFMLMSEGATVTVCHHMTRSVSMHSRRADAIFVATGVPALITGDMVKPGATVIDIGINAVTGPDGTSRIVGDVDFASVAEVAGWVTPVPGGVGPVTVSILMRNTLAAVKRQIAARQQPLHA